MAGSPAYILPPAKYSGGIPFRNWPQPSPNSAAAASRMSDSAVRPSVTSNRNWSHGWRDTRRCGCDKDRNFRSLPSSLFSDRSSIQPINLRLFLLFFNQELFAWVLVQS